MLLTSGPHPAQPSVNADPFSLAMEKTSLPSLSSASRCQEQVEGTFASWKSEWWGPIKYTAGAWRV